MQRFESLVVQAGRSVGSIALNRPEALNALNDQMLMELPGAIQSLEDDPAVRCIVLTGNGSAFCSGFDLKEQMQNRPHGIQDWEPLLDGCFNAVMSLWNCRLPTILEVHRRGSCVTANIMDRCEATGSLSI